MTSTVSIHESVAAVVATAQARSSPQQATVVPSEFLSFRLGTKEYGIDILRVQEIRSYEAPTRIAHAADSIKGIVDLRGVIVPIVDLRIRVGCLTEYNATTAVIVVNAHSRAVGLVVDAVTDVVALGASQIHPAPPLGTQANSDHVLGIGSIAVGGASRTLILTDIQRLLSDLGLWSMDAQTGATAAWGQTLLL